MELQLQFPVDVREPEKEHVIAVVFFTPGEWKSNKTSQSMLIQAGPMGPRGQFEDGTDSNKCSEL